MIKKIIYLRNASFKFKESMTLYIDKKSLDLKLTRFCGSIYKIKFRCIDTRYENYTVSITMDLLFGVVAFNYDSKIDKSKTDLRPYDQCFAIDNDHIKELVDLIYYLLF